MVVVTVVLTEVAVVICTQLVLILEHLTWFIVNSWCVTVGQLAFQLFECDGSPVLSSGRAIRGIRHDSLPQAQSRPQGRT